VDSTVTSILRVASVSNRNAEGFSFLKIVGVIAYNNGKVDTWKRGRNTEQPKDDDYELLFHMEYGQTVWQYSATAKHAPKYLPDGSIDHAYLQENRPPPEAVSALAGLDQPNYLVVSPGGIGVIPPNGADHSDTWGGKVERAPAQASTRHVTGTFEEQSNRLEPVLHTVVLRAHNATQAVESAGDDIAYAVKGPKQGVSAGGLDRRRPTSEENQTAIPSSDWQDDVRST
jgi:hypothetical protein